MTYTDAYLYGFFITWIICALGMFGGSTFRDGRDSEILIVTIFMALIWPITVAMIVWFIWDEVINGGW